MEWYYFAGIGVIIFLILMLIFKRYTSALFYDLIDLVLSSADNLLAGVGALGLDIGDWISAFIIFKKERKITNGFVAFMVMWEATNFLPISLIPGVGEGVEIFFNFFPAVFIARLFFNKYHKAENAEHKLEQDMELADKAGIDVQDKGQILKKVKKLIQHQDPVDALKIAKKYDKNVTAKLVVYVQNLISETQSVIQSLILSSHNQSDELVEMLKQGVSKSEQLLKEANDLMNKNDIINSLSKVLEAKNILKSCYKNANNILEVERINDLEKIDSKKDESDNSDIGDEYQKAA